MKRLLGHGPHRNCMADLSHPRPHPLPERHSSADATSRSNIQRFAVPIAGLIRLAAALVRQVPDQTFHAVKTTAVEQKAALPATGDESCDLQLLQVERQRGRWNVELLRNHARREPLGAPLDQEPEYRQSRFVSERGQGAENVCRFHLTIQSKYRVPVKRHAV